MSRGLRAAAGESPVAAERHLQATAQRQAVDGGHHGLRRALRQGDDLREARALDAARELGDVGASDPHAIAMATI